MKALCFFTLVFLVDQTTSNPRLAALQGAQSFYTPHGAEGNEAFIVKGMLNKKNGHLLQKIDKMKQHHGVLAALQPADIKFYLWRQNALTYYSIEWHNITNLENMPYNKTLKTKMVIHGWMNSGSSEFPMVMKNVLLKKEDMNVIVVDWSSVAYGFIYPWTLSYVPEVGKIVGDGIIQLMNSINLNISTTHLLGHSLGAHVAGYAGKRIKAELEDVTIPWITGLDPAKPWVSNNPNKRLDKEDGLFVDIIHTCGDFLGFASKIGDVDFFPNGGSLIQPGCGIDLGVCSHNRAYYYYVEALTSDSAFQAYPCDSWAKFILGGCQDNESAKVGSWIGYSSDRPMFFKTGNHSPFSSI